MRIAIPTFGERISPRFDCAPEFLIVEVNDGEVIDQRRLSALDWAPRRRVARLIELGVETVVCGGIDRFSDARLRAEGIDVYGWKTGETTAALQRLLDGEMEPSPVPDANGCGRGHRHRGGRCRNS